MMDTIDVEEMLADDSCFGVCHTGTTEQQADDEVLEIFEQWRSCGVGPFPSGSGGNHHGDAKGLKYIDTRTFTRPKKKIDTVSDESGGGVASPLLNLQIGGPVTSLTPSAHRAMMQKSWLCDVSPTEGMLSSMDFANNDTMGNSLITSGDFTNVSYLLNTDDLLTSQSNFNGYKLTDVIKDRQFLEALCFDDNALTKDCNISRTDLNAIESASGVSTMQNSYESSSRMRSSFDDEPSGDSTESGHVTMIIKGGGSLNATFQLDDTLEAPAVTTVGGPTSEKRRSRNFDTYRKPKSTLNSTFDALPTVGEPPVVGHTPDVDAIYSRRSVMNTTFGVVDGEPVGGNGTFSVNRIVKVPDGGEKQLNQTYEFVTPPTMAEDDMPSDATGCAREALSNILEESDRQHTPNGTFNTRHIDKDNSFVVQSTPLHAPTKRTSNVSEFEANFSPIAQHPGRRSRNLERDMGGTASSSSLETDDFDVEIRKAPATARSRLNKTENVADISNFLDAEHRISLQRFEDFEKSILESESNGIDFDEMLNSLTDVKRSSESEKLRQSVDNIKKRHSRINLEKQQQEDMKRHQLAVENSLPIDNKLMESMTKSMSSSGGSERLLNRRSRYNEEVHLTLSPQQQKPEVAPPPPTADSDYHPSINGTALADGPCDTDPVSTGNEVETCDRKNRDRFKTIRISKRREEGMVIVVDGDADLQPTIDSGAPSLPEEEDEPVSPTQLRMSAFGKVDYNSPKPTRVSNLEKTEAEEVATFKKPQAIPRPESKLRSLSKPRYYSGSGSGGVYRKDLTLTLTNKASSTDNLENNRYNSNGFYQSQQQQQQQQQHRQPHSQLQQQRLSSASKLGGSGGLVPPTLKSPMGTKSKSYHSLNFGQSSGYGSSGNLSKISAPLGSSIKKLSHNSSNNELKSNTSKLQSNLRIPRANLPIRPAAPEAAGTADLNNRTAAPAAIAVNSSRVSSVTSVNVSPNNTSKLNPQLSAVQMRPPTAKSRLGLVRPSSGYFSYSTHRRHPDSDNESINSLSSSSASSRGSLYRVDSQTVANNVQMNATNSIEDVYSVSNGPPVPKQQQQQQPSLPVAAAPVNGIGSGLPKASGLRPPSNLRAPTVRSGLPRPTTAGYAKR